MRINRAGRTTTILLTGIFIVWSSLFIYRSSYIALDGHRYFGLFDDAMVSMRYAWNFAHGLGLVWNAGQRVEGYSNLLMTLVMSLPAWFLNKEFAVLAVQVLGIPTIIVSAYFTRQIASEINAGKPHQELISVLALATVLFYYPLSYWTLMGMETGLLAALLLGSTWLALRWLRTNQASDPVGMSILAGLAFLTRNDSMLLAGLLFAYVFLETYLNKGYRPTLLKILYAVCLFLLFPVGQSIFRYFYYGQLVPNTYTLKLTAFPLSIRLIDGIGFIMVFIQQSALIFLFAGLGLLLDFRRIKAFLFSFMAVVIAYQVYVGGDPWDLWRILAPAMPCLLILAITGCVTIVNRSPLLTRNNLAGASLIVLLTFAALAWADLPFLSDMSVRGPTSAAIANRVNTNTAIAINSLTSPDASIGVIWAGTLPYYTDRYAVDFLGKSDPYIAHLKADVSGGVRWGDMISVPGHNKYDLNYSIVQLRPTYIQGFAWGNQTVKPWVVENYVRVEYHGAAGVKTIFLDKDSPYVCWKACQDKYKIVPWPKQK